MVPDAYTNHVLKCDYGDNCDFETLLPNAFKCHTKSYLVCPECPMQFCGKRSKRHLETHFRRVHNFKPKDPYFCEVCSKPFGHMSVLKKHLKKSKCGKVPLIDHDYEPVYGPVAEPLNDPIGDPIHETFQEPTHEPIHDPIGEPVDGHLEIPINQLKREPVDEVIDDPLFRNIDPLSEHP